MYVHKSRYLKFDAVQVWWPTTVEAVCPLLDQAPVVMLWQCPLPLVAEFRRWTFRTKPFQTPLIDLAPTEEELYQKLHRTSCRKEVRQAQEMNLVVTRNEKTELARTLINDSIRRLRYRQEVSESAWQALLPDHDVFLCQSQDIPVAAHVILADHPQRARPVNSGTADRKDERIRGVVGHANRLLHWREMLHYKAAGIRYYDFGGCDFSNKESPEYAISQFKLSFGAEVVEEPMLYLAKSPALRLFLRSLAATRGRLRQIPWPDTWLQAVRTHPKLSAFFR
jgi:hypothetical protein